MPTLRPIQYSALAANPNESISNRFGTTDSDPHLVFAGYMAADDSLPVGWPEQSDAERIERNQRPTRNP